MKKQTKIILSVLTLFLLVAGGLFLKLKNETIDIEPIVLVEPKKEQIVEPIIEDKEPETVAEIPKKVVITEPKTEEVFVETEPDDPEKIKPTPYNFPLPEYPDEELNNSTLLGIDTSEPGTPGYGVRDDVEIAIVEEFGDDEKTTEYLLSSFAYQQKMLELFERGVDKNLYNYLSAKAGSLNFCASSSFKEFGRKNNTISPTDYSNHFWKVKREITNELFLNSLNRKIAEQEADGGMGAALGGTVGLSEDKCKELHSLSLSDLQADLYLINTKI